MKQSMTIVSQRWIGRLSMCSGAIVGSYAFYNVLRYSMRKDHVIPPLIFGSTAMAFSAACSFVLVGLALFWVGWSIQHVSEQSGRAAKILNNQIMQLVLAFISSLTLILTAWISSHHQ